jgi:hypothetical protein
MRRPPTDIAGQRFGRLVAERFSHKAKGAPYWLCRCDCGAETVVRIYALLDAHTFSCGCQRRERLTTRTHGCAPRGKVSATYRCWQAMKSRCFNPRNKAWKHYGGRGITVCERWLVFENFLADMGERPPGKTLDRINNDGNYEPGNCRWATQSEQVNNSRRWSR